MFVCYAVPCCAVLQIGGSGVLVQPMTYIFDEEPLRWQRLLENLGETHSLCYHACVV